MSTDRRPLMLRTLSNLLPWHSAFRIGVNLYPPFLGAGVRVVEVQPDGRRIVVEMGLRWWNRNYVGTHFGGSLYTMTDPFPMLMLLHALGPEFIVLDKSATVRFRKPARGTVRAVFELDEDRLESIRERIHGGMLRLDELFVVPITDESGLVVAEVEKVVFIRAKHATGLTSPLPVQALLTAEGPTAPPVAARAPTDEIRLPGAPHTLIFSDIHLTTAEAPDPRYPLWMRYKHPDLFPDAAIAEMIDQVLNTVTAPIELILNGDIFDFDAATALPDEPLPFSVSPWERLRGLSASEEKSTWKMDRILDDHPVFVDAVRRVLARGHRVVFVVGNHDMELLWPGVQATLLERLGFEQGHDVRVCDWFYVSNQDTLVEHGHQYDAYCLCHDPISPLVRMPPNGEVRMRLPFGDHAARFMLNGMGLINPYVSEGWVMPFGKWVVFFYQHVARTQPLLLWTWIWTAFATFMASARDAVLPAERDVLGLEDRVEEIALRAQSTPRVVRALDAIKVHPAIFLPWKVLRELWLDRLLMIVLMVLGSFQVTATVHALFGFSLWWWFLVLALVLMPFVFYAQRVSSDVGNLDRMLRRRLPLLPDLLGVHRIVLGHTHEPRHVQIPNMEVLNPGTWSASFRDVECTIPAGQRCVVQIAPTGEGPRVATLDAWTPSGFATLAPTPEAIEASGLMPGESWWDSDVAIPKTRRFLSRWKFPRER